MFNIIRFHLTHTMQTHADLFMSHNLNRLVGENNVLYHSLHLIRELVTLATEYFDAVMLKGIVRCGNDDARIRLLLHSQERHSGGRDSTERHNAAAHGTNTCHERGFQHIRRNAGILANSDGGGAALFTGQNNSDRLTDTVGQLCGQGLTDHTSNTVGAK